MNDQATATPHLIGRDLRQVLKFGVLVGLVGGTVMALFAMTAMKLRGDGFFTPVNLFAHTFWSDAPLDGTFVLSSIELGLLIHLTMSIGIGLAISFLVSRGELDAAMVFLLALGAGAGAWMFQAVAWTALDTEAHGAFTPWILAVAHVMFAMGAATFLLWLQGREQRSAETPAVETTPTPIVEHVTTPRATRSGWVRENGL